MLRNYDPIVPFAVPAHRHPQSFSHAHLSEFGPIISADSHFSVAKDIWYEGFPAHLRDKAPRIWLENGIYQVGFGGKSMFPKFFEANLLAYDPLPGTTQIAPRMRDLDAEGVQKELVFGNAILGLLSYPNLEVREWIFRLYNDHLLELGSESNGRFVGVPLGITWDPALYASFYADIGARFHTVMLPLKPGKDVDGVEINYADEKRDPMWNSIEAAGVPVCFHIGENLTDGRGGVGTSMLLNYSPFRQVIGQLIFGGVFDRHPKLKVAFVEGGIHWVPGLIHDMEAVCSGQGSMFDWTLKHSPQYYWDKHCYATFMRDPIGLEMIDRIGADRVMWSSDYPHPESTFGKGWQAIEAVVDALSADDARKVLGGNARALFKM